MPSPRKIRNSKFEIRNSRRRLYCGIEGGSTKTVAVMIDEDGRIVQRVRTSPCNIKLLDDRQILNLWEGIRHRLRNPTPFIGMFVAGCVSPSDEARVKRLAQKVWMDSKITVGKDTDSGFAAALGDKPGVMVICGTGSNVLARNQSHSCKLGGWGHVVGDVGGGYDLARLMLQRTFLEYDEDRQTNAFGREVLRQLGLNTMEELVTWTLAASKEDIASLAPLVFKHKELSRDVIREGTFRLSLQVVRAAELVRLQSPRVVLTGGLAVGQPYYVLKLKQAILMKLPHARVGVSREEGAYGAALICRSKFISVHPATKLYRWIKPPRDRGDLYRGSIESRNLASAPTEQPNPRARHLERASIRQLIDLMSSEEATVIPQILKHRESLEQAIEWVVLALKAGGRLFYVGAGTSGRLGVLDAAECPPTFGTPPSMVQGIIAGGFRALYQAIETAEDDEVYGAESLANRNAGRKDVVVGITASGSTPFVVGALRTGLKSGARCILLTCNPKTPAELKGARFLKLVVETGPEVVAGSTRLKAGTATKLVLNMLTTISMIRLGRVKDNLMTDVQPSCEKLQDRMTRILKELRGSSYEEAWAALKREGWSLKRVLAKKAKRTDR